LNDTCKENIEKYNEHTGFLNLKLIKQRLVLYNLFWIFVSNVFCEYYHETYQSTFTKENFNFKMIFNLRIFQILKYFVFVLVLNWNSIKKTHRTTYETLQNKYKTNQAN